MRVWRVHLKTDKNAGYTYADLLDFCRQREIIGVGWYLIETHNEDDSALRNEIQEHYHDGATAALKAVNAIKAMQPGDLVWTRPGTTASKYYLCRVGETLWKDRIVTQEHRDFDIGNFVSAQWFEVGTEDMVPGKVVNSFCPSASAQSVSSVEKISMQIWNDISGSGATKYQIDKMTWDDFWVAINSEELECLVLLYIQALGYYIYSTTAKLSTARFEAVLVSRDGSHRAYPQVKREVPLPVEDYYDDVENGDKVFLFTTSEKYGEGYSPNIVCISKSDLKRFVQNNKAILPKNILFWEHMLINSNAGEETCNEN